jgi:hypothetical protein
MIAITEADEDTQRRALDALSAAGIEVYRTWFEPDPFDRRPHDPRAVTEAYVGKHVIITLTSGETLDGELLGCGESGLTIASGIGGRRTFPYGEIDSVQHTASRPT